MDYYDMMGGLTVGTTLFNARTNDQFILVLAAVLDARL